MMPRPINAGGQPIGTSAEINSETARPTPEKPPRIYLSPPSMLGRERELLLDAFDSNWIAPLGPHVDAFEREFAGRVGVPHALALASGTAALHLALQIIGVRAGDEVFTSTFTFVATANAIKYVGAEPVFIDSEPASWNIDPHLLEQELRAARQANRRIGAVLAVDIIGQCANYTAIREICDRFQVPLIEDAAEALGASLHGEPAGSFGDIGCFSFNGNKIITTSGGGMLVTRREDWAQQARKLATQAREPAPHYQHEMIGYNYRMSNLVAAVGRGQLEMLDAIVQKRRDIFQVYADALGNLPGIEFMPEIPGGRCTRWLTSLLIDPQQFGRDRESVRLALEAENIESRPTWKPMHQQPVFRGCKVVGGQVADRIFATGLSLPSGTNLSPQDQKRVVERVAGRSETRREFR